MSLLNVNDLSVSFVTRNGTTEAVKNVSFSVEAKSITAIIGESGSGKSVSCYALLGLIPQPQDGLTLALPNLTAKIYSPCPSENFGAFGAPTLP